MIEPALTAEEWAEVGENACLDCYTHDKKIPVDTFVEPEDISRHALAALCLHEQPFGFTRGDVRHLRKLAASRVTHGYGDYGPPDQYHPWISSLADRIAALLPPEEDAT